MFIFSYVGYLTQNRYLSSTVENATESEVSSAGLTITESSLGNPLKT